MAFMGLWMVKAWLDVYSRRERASAKDIAILGLVNALAGLTNTTFLPFALVIAPFAWLWRSRERLGPALRQVALYWAVLVCAYSPWPIRNYLVFKTWILGSTAGAGSTFYTYLVVPQELGGTPAQIEIVTQNPVLREGERLPPVAREQFFWKAATTWIREHPLAYARLFAWRVADYWRLWPRPRSYGANYAMIKWISILTDGWIIPLGLAGLAFFLWTSPASLWPCVFVLSLNALYAAIFTMIRYRFSVMPWIILFASALLVRLNSRFFPARRSR